MSSPLLSRAALETISTWAEVLTVVLTMLGAFCGVIYVAASRPLRKLEARESLEEKQKTAQAQKEAAEAQLQLQKHVEYVRKEAGWRYLSPRFAEALKNRPTGTVEILYKAEDMEAYTFSIQVWRALKDARWVASHPKPIPAEVGSESLPDAPAQLRHGTSGPICLIAKRYPTGFGENTAAGAIWDAVRSALDVNSGFSTSADLAMPDDHFIIVVGQK
ncbi:MAG: hypothetical protein ABSD98_00885 [Candidatus Korobacteraceae bacterium]|jgi:hypothetical protein